MYAIPADVQNPASHFDTLVAQLAPPPLMQQDVMYTLRDKDFPRHYLLLLDSSTGMNEKRYGRGCHDCAHDRTRLRHCTKGRSACALEARDAEDC